MTPRAETFGALALARGAIGVVSLAAPVWMADRWFGPPTARTTERAVRAIGVRDVVLAAGMLAGRSTRQRSLFGRVAALADAGDAIASIVVAVRRQPRRPLIGGAIAAGSAVVGSLVLPRTRVP